MKLSKDPQNEQGVKSILSDAFLKDLKNSGSIVVQYLAENNSYFGWIPRMPLKMFHNPKDDYVPVGNMRNALKDFPNVPTVFHEEFNHTFNLDESVHACSLPDAYIKGFLWLDSIANSHIVE